MWANTVLSTGKVLACVVYNGKETRMALNSKVARHKMGQIDLEMSRLTKLLCGFMVIMATVLIFLKSENIFKEW